MQSRPLGSLDARRRPPGLPLACPLRRQIKLGACRVTWNAMAFWGAEVKPGKAVPFVPPPEASKLHLSQVRPRAGLA